jgi:hypothetical protein
MLTYVHAYIHTDDSRGCLQKRVCRHIHGPVPGADARVEKSKSRRQYICFGFVCPDLHRTGMNICVCFCVVYSQCVYVSCEGLEMKVHDRICFLDEYTCIYIYRLSSHVSFKNMMLPGIYMYVCVRVCLSIYVCVCVCIKAGPSA